MLDVDVNPDAIREQFPAPGDVLPGPRDAIPEPRFRPGVIRRVGEPGLERAAIPAPSSSRSPIGLRCFTTKSPALDPSTPDRLLVVVNFVVMNSTTKLTTTSNLSGVLGSNAGDFVVKHRKPIGDLLTKGPDGRPLQARLSYATNYTGTKPGLWDGVTGTWQNIAGGWELLPDRIGIYVNVQHPNTWHVGAATGAAAAPIVLKGIEDLTSATPYTLRLTCVIAGDHNLQGLADEPTSVLSYPVRQRSTRGTATAGHGRQEVGKTPGRPRRPSSPGTTGTGNGRGHLPPGRERVRRAPGHGDDRAIRGVLRDRGPDPEPGRSQPRLPHGRQFRGERDAGLSQRRRHRLEFRRGRSDDHADPERRRRAAAISGPATGGDGVKESRTRREGAGSGGIRVAQLARQCWREAPTRCAGARPPRRFQPHRQHHAAEEIPMLTSPAP